MAKKHFEYGNIRFSIDTCNGEITGLENLIMGDNIVKNTMTAPEFYGHQPFTITLRDDNGEENEYYPLYTRIGLESPEKAVKISSEEKPDGILVKVEYNTITCQVVDHPHTEDITKEIPCDLYYTAYVKENSIEFEMNYVNVGGRNVREIRFPVIAGVYLGSDHTKNTLYYPLYGGRKIVDPINTFTAQPERSFWRWNEYRYCYSNDIASETPRHMWGCNYHYPCNLSMSYMDITCEDYGMYFGAHTPDLTPVWLECATFGKWSIALVLSSSYQPKKSGEFTFKTPPTILAFHGSSWHDGAKIYRDFRLPLIKMRDSVKPVWARTSPALSAHYDFKYQEGNHYHEFKDIEQMAKDSKAMGVDHMIFAGWNQDGFDNGYPNYVPDKDCGTEQEFIDGIKKAKDLGVHVSLYENSQLYNTIFDKGDVIENVVINEDGNYSVQHWGLLTLAVMCPKAKGWQDQVAENFRRATEEYGVSGIYFDQLSAGIQFCHNPRHNHKGYSDCADGRLEMLERVRDNYKAKFGDEMMIIGEWVTDAFGGMLTYQLNQTYFEAQKGYYPDLFRYTFPEFGLLDVIHPKNSLMAPAHIAADDKIWATNFTNGTTYWLYHVENDVNYLSHKPSLDAIKEMNALSRLRLQKAGDYTFVDTDGVSADDELARVRRFDGKDGKALVAGFRFSDKEVKVTLDKMIKKAESHLSNGKIVKLKKKGNTFILPKEKMSIVFVEFK